MRSYSLLQQVLIDNLRGLHRKGTVLPRRGLYGLGAGLLAFAIVGVLQASSTLAGSVPENEPNDNCLGPQPINCGDVVAPAQIQPVNDDWYTFLGNANDILDVAVDDEPADPNDPNDPVIEVFADDCGTLLVADDNGGPGNFPLIQGFVLPYTGQYNIRVGSNDPGDFGGYVLVTDCQPGGGKLSRQEATDIFLDDVLPTSPFADTLVAFLYDPDGPDSTLAAGTVLQSWDFTFTEVIPSEVYLVWTDDEQGFEWSHHASFVLIDAFTGFIQPFETDGWPVIDGQPVRRFMTDGNDSPEKIAGTYQSEGPPVTIDYTLKCEGSTKDWVIIAVGKNLSGAGERKARNNDKNRILEIVNGYPKGPKVHKDNIIILDDPTTEGNGTTKQAICDALENLDENCESLSFWYIGHGSDDKSDEEENPHGPGLILNGATEDEEDILEYNRLSGKLALTGIPEMTVVIEACYSGWALEEFEQFCFPIFDLDDIQEKTKGRIVTSSSKDRCTQRDDNNGTPFIRSLHNCWADAAANLNNSRDGTDVFEALAWAKSLEPRLSTDKPAGRMLGDERVVQFANAGCKKWTDRRSAGGEIKYEMKTYCYRVLGGAASGKDSLVCRKRIYAINPNSDDKSYSRNVTFECLNKKGQVISEICTWRKPKFTRGDQVICVTDVPQECVRVRTKRAPKDAPNTCPKPPPPPPPSRLPATDLFFAGTDTSVTAEVETFTGYYVPKGPGVGSEGFVFYPYELPGVVGDVWTAQMIEPSDAWNFSATPDSFVVPSLADTQFVLVRSVVPDTALVGTSAVLRLVNETEADTFDVTYDALIYSTISGDLLDGFSSSYQALDVDGTLTSTAGAITLRNSVVKFNAAPLPASCFIDAGGSLTISETSVAPDSAGAYDFEIRGSVDWNAGLLTEPIEGLVLDGATGNLDFGGVLVSQGRGLTARGDLSGLTSSFFFIDGSATDGAVFDGATGVLFDNLTVLDSGIDDVVLINGSTVELRDSCFDDGKVSVETGSELTRSFGTAIFTFLSDENETVVEGADVEVRDAFGTLVGSSTTRPSGISEEVVLRKWVDDGTTVTAYTPHEILVSYAGWDTTFFFSADTSLVVDVPIPPAVSSSPEQPEPPIPVVPVRTELLAGRNPVRRGDTLALTYSLHAPSDVRLRIFDIQGRQIWSTFLRRQAPGNYAMEAGQKTLESGVYFLRMEAGEYRGQRKVVVIQ